jgi:hypothetical protein
VLFHLADKLAIALLDDDESVRSAIRRQMDPYPPCEQALPAPAATLEVDGDLDPTLVDVQRPANDGLVTGTDGQTLYLLAGTRACALADPLAEPPARFRYQPGFPVGRLLRPVVRPALQVALTRVDAVAVHSSCVDLDGHAILVAGWSESGKTETALAFAEDGARFVADKWTIVGSDGAAAPFPISVGVRRWVLPYLPRLRAALPQRARAQMLAAGVAAGASKPVRAVARESTIGRAFERAAGLADRAALRLSEVAAVYGGSEDPTRSAQLHAVALLTTVPGRQVSAEAIDPDHAARRLARTAAYERRGFFALDERIRFADPLRRERAAVIVEEFEEEFLGRLLASIAVIDVRAPFPTDPRPVRDAIARCL